MAHLLEKPPPPKPVLTIIKQRVRPVFTSNPKAKDLFEQELLEWDQSNTGCIPTDMMKELLDNMQVQFEGNEWNDFKKVFGIGRGNCHFNYRKLFKGLDLGTPEDHVEPEQFVDQLPQPYRMIVKVLEEDILEAGWNMICKAHPELLEDQTDPIRARKLESASQATPASVLEGIGTVTCTNWEKSSTVLFAGTISGHLAALSVERESLLTSLALFTDIPYGVSCLSNVVGNLGSEYPLRIAASALTPPPVTISPPSQTPTKSRGRSRGKQLSRQASNKTDKDDALQKGSTDKKSTRIIMVEAFYDNTKSVIKMSSSGVLDMNFSILDLAIASNGRYLAMVTHEGSVMVSLLPEQHILEITKEKMDEIDEDKEVEFAKRQKGPFTIDQPIMIIPPVYAASFDFFLAEEREITLPNFQCVADFLTIPKDPSSNQEPQPFPMVKSMAVWRHNSNIWRKYKLPPPLEETKEDEGDDDASQESQKEKKTGRKKKGDDEEDEIKVKTVEPIVELELLLPGSITCSALDGSTTLLALGTKEGGVFLYDLQTGLLFAALEQHQLATTGLCFLQRRYLVSVSEDERIHFYDLLPGPGKRPCLLGYRHDFSDPVCGVTTLTSVPVVFAQDIKGQVACYDVETQDLIGSLELTGGGDLAVASRHLSACLSQRVNPDDEENEPRPEERTQVKYFKGKQAVWCSSSQYLSILCAPKILKQYKFPQISEDFNQSVNQDGGRPKSPDPDIEDSKKLSKKGSTLEDANETLASSAGPGGIPATSLLGFSDCDLILQLCPGVLAVCGEDAEIEAVRGVFRKLTPEQRRNAALIPENMMPAMQSMTSLKTFGSLASSRGPRRMDSMQYNSTGTLQQGARQTSRQNSARLPSNQPPRQDSAFKLASRQNSMKQNSNQGPPPARKASTFVNSSMGSLAKSPPPQLASKQNSFRENRDSGRSLPSASVTGGGEFGVPTEENMNVMMGGEMDPGLPAFRFKTPGLAVKKCLAERHIGKVEREQRIQRRRQELLQML